MRRAPTFSSGKGIAMSTTETPAKVEGAAASTQKRPAEVDPETKYRTVVESGQHALRALLTINGGAIIAFLTFVGHLWDKGGLPPQASVSLLATALEILIVGTFLTVLAYGAIFLTNVLSRYNRTKGSDRMFGVTLVFGFLSAVSFLVASLYAVKFFLSVSK